MKNVAALLKDNQDVLNSWFYYFCGWRWALASCTWWQDRVWSKYLGFPGIQVNVRVSWGRIFHMYWNREVPLKMKMLHNARKISWRKCWKPWATTQLSRMFGHCDDLTCGHVASMWAFNWLTVISCGCDDVAFVINASLRFVSKLYLHLP